MIIEQQINDTLVRHYSDVGVMIKQVETGTMYSDAVDVIPCRYTYQETDSPVEQTPETTEAEYLGYLKKLWVDVDGTEN